MSNLSIFPLWCHRAIRDLGRLGWVGAGCPDLPWTNPIRQRPVVSQETAPWRFEPAALIDRHKPRPES